MQATAGVINTYGHVAANSLHGKLSSAVIITNVAK